MEDHVTTNKTRRGWKSLKKNLGELKEYNPNKLILFFDESRFGNRTKTGLGWFIKGSRTPIRVNLGYKNFYLYSVVSPKDGGNFSLLLPFANSCCINVFLKRLSGHYKKEEKEIILIMDGAPWHRCQYLEVPNNIKIILLPPYCPELNPVKRLWKYIKDNVIKNRIFKTLKEVEDAVYEFVKGLSDEVVRMICGGMVVN